MSHLARAVRLGKYMQRNCLPQSFPWAKTASLENAVGKCIFCQILKTGLTDSGHENQHLKSWYFSYARTLDCWCKCEMRNYLTSIHSLRYRYDTHVFICLCCFCDRGRPIYTWEKPGFSCHHLMGFLVKFRFLSACFADRCRRETCLQTATRRG